MRTKKKSVYDWHDFFPIIPVEAGEWVVWLETVERRAVYVGYAQDDYSGRSDHRWEYRTKENK